MAPRAETFQQIDQISRWLKTAVPQPSDQNIRTQIGVHFEEVHEMLQALHQADATDSACDQLGLADDVMSYFQRRIKDRKLEIDVDRIVRVALLDALCDQIVTAVGVAHMLGMDIGGALKEVADSNDSMFGEDGKPIFSEKRKIVRGRRYRSPGLAAYMVRSTHEDDSNAEEKPA